MTDLLGPASAPNATTIRPSDARVFPADDTWMKPCSGPGVQDGTAIQAVFLNGILAQVRRAIRGMAIAVNNSDDDMLLKAITAARDYYLIDTAVTKTVGGVGADFTDLAAAFQWLSKYRITQNGSVVFNLAAGQAIYAASIAVDHPNLDRVTINGANLLAAAPSSGTFTVTGPSSGQRASDNAANIAALRAIYATEIKFTSQRGFDFFGPRPTINNLLITGPGTGTAAADGLTMRSDGALSNVSVHGFGGYGIIPYGVVIASGAVTASGCNYGIAANNGTNFVWQNASVIANSNAVNGVLSVGGSVRANGTGAIVCNGNGVAGYSGTAGASFAPAANASGFGLNGNYGVYAYQSDAAVIGGNFVSNGSNSVVASSGANVDATGATGVSGSCSPAANTVGNANSYIKV